MSHETRIGSFADVLLENLQRLLHQLPPILLLFIGRKLWVAGGADDVAGSHGAEGSRFLGHRIMVQISRPPYIQPLDFFADRCAAASAGASGGGQNDAGHPCGLWSARRSPADASAALSAAAWCAGGVNRFMELADDALLLQLADDVERRAPGDAGLDWPMRYRSPNGPRRIHSDRPVHSDHWNGCEARGAAGFMRSGSPSGTRPPSVTRAITADEQIANRSGGLDVLEPGRRNLRLERLAANFCQEHIHGAFGGRLGSETLRLMPRGKYPSSSGGPTARP